MSATDPHQVLHRTIEAVWRIESARVIAGLTRLARDVGLPEDLAQVARRSTRTVAAICHRNPHYVIVVAPHKDTQSGFGSTIRKVESAHFATIRTT